MVYIYILIILVGLLTISSKPTVTTTKPTTTESPATTVPETMKTTQIIRRPAVWDITEPTSTMTLEVSTFSIHETTFATWKVVAIIGVIIFIVIIVAVLGWKYRIHREQKKAERYRKRNDAIAALRDARSIAAKKPKRKKKTIPLAMFDSSEHSEKPAPEFKDKGVRVNANAGEPLNSKEKAFVP